MTYYVISGLPVVEDSTDLVLMSKVYRTDSWFIVDLILAAMAEAAEEVDVDVTVAVIKEPYRECVFSHGPHIMKVVDAFNAIPRERLEALEPITPDRPEGAPLH